MAMRGSATAPGRSTAARVARARYLYEVEVYAPTTRQGRDEPRHRSVLGRADPELDALGRRRPARPGLAARVWREDRVAEARAGRRLERSTSCTSATSRSATPPCRRRTAGTYLAFTDDGDGHAAPQGSSPTAGLNTVHLLPTFDIASIEEDPAAQQTPACDLASYAPDSDQQQACVDGGRRRRTASTGATTRSTGLAPEGSYASPTRTAAARRRVPHDGRRRCTGTGLRVVLDQVFNHTAGVRPGATSRCSTRSCPATTSGSTRPARCETSTCCQNVATEHAMVEKLMVDSVVTWARSYKVDGFRFDLMGHHSKENMLALRAALDELTAGQGRRRRQAASTCTARAGTSARSRTTRCSSRPRQGNLGGTGIGTFSDRLRDAVRGGGPFDEDPRMQGFGTGVSHRPQRRGGQRHGAERRLARPRHGPGQARPRRQPRARSPSRTAERQDGARATRSTTTAPPPATPTSRTRSISYVDAHDNETLCDSLTFKLPVATSMADRVRMNTVSLATTALAQTPSFWHAGTDLLRSQVAGPQQLRLR